MRTAAINTTEYSMESDFAVTSKTFVDASSQTEDSNVTFITRSDSFNMIVDTPTTIEMTTSITTLTVVSTSSSSVAFHVSLAGYRLP